MPGVKWMREAGERALPQRLPRWRWLVLLAAAALAGPWGCDRQPSRTKGRSATQPAAWSQRVPPPPVRPEYTFTNEDREQHPEIVGFLRHFFETCLAGDYAGYRRLCSRRREPETPERFEAIYHALRRLRVESIEPRSLPELPEPAYLVTCDVEFHPDSEARLRRKTNKFAILVIREAGQWRILPAPSRMQPAPEPAPTTTSAPTATAPSYPWDDDGDF